jgi:hypothetical protein
LIKELRDAAPINRTPITANTFSGLIMWLRLVTDAGTPLLLSTTTDFATTGSTVSELAPKAFSRPLPRPRGYRGKPLSPECICQVL